VLALRDVADDYMATFTNIHMLHVDRLFAAVSIAL
jgi:hypothetical protein